MELVQNTPFSLAFENSLHPDYVTEKLSLRILWRRPPGGLRRTVVLGPSRRNHEKFLPPDAFIHVNDFQSPKELAQALLPLDTDHALYHRYFCSRETLRPRSFRRALMFRKACWRLQQESPYQTVPSTASWFT
ncbi:LOW QUALITY PROTEIN: alpha-(1,3)-fucosyltransferase 5-like [Phoca vitulina]|uniref:LOW QUALITY PROTEIN: alpha-(1,3)-fucosyltransferase 5-like n=1 Tax=Phoca vitulina TaxID=9720 RepID=UPI0013964355|nr:LOW QUALITY PROTEIN: alpha-(1,3)-fucosyltransferase 5-like [Phoca vitulina]